MQSINNPGVPSVKALTQFPSVLANMDKNLSWTSALGDAYFNQSQDVLNAVAGGMRKRAQSAGTLKTTAQQTVTTANQTVSYRTHQSGGHLFA